MNERRSADKFSNDDILSKPLINSLAKLETARLTPMFREADKVMELSCLSALQAANNL